MVEEVELILYYCNHVWQEDWETFHHAVFSGPDGAAHRFIPRYENPNPPVMITDIKMWGLLLGEMDQLFAEGFCQNLALMANCGDDCVLLLFCGREALAYRVPYCQAGYFREWLQLLI